MFYQGLDTIDVTTLKLEGAGHDYAFSHPRVVGDIKALWLEQKSPSERGLREAKRAADLYWEIWPESP